MESRLIKIEISNEKSINHSLLFKLKQNLDSKQDVNHVLKSTDHLCLKYERSEQQWKECIKQKHYHKEKF